MAQCSRQPVLFCKEGGNDQDILDYIQRPYFLTRKHTSRNCSKMIWQTHSVVYFYFHMKPHLIRHSLMAKKLTPIIMKSPKWQHIHVSETARVTWNEATTINKTVTSSASETCLSWLRNGRGNRLTDQSTSIIMQLQWVCKAAEKKNIASYSSWVIVLSHSNIHVNQWQTIERQE